MMEFARCSILRRMNGTYWSQLKVPLMILMMIACLVDLCSAAPFHQRSKDEQDTNDLLKVITYATHFVHCLFAAGAAAIPGSRSDGEKICIVFSHVVFWIAGHTSILNRTDVGNVFDEHCSHAIIRAVYSGIGISLVLRTV
eukprot:scpid77323/ scgid34580/ 